MKKIRLLAALLALTVLFAGCGAAPMDEGYKNEVGSDMSYDAQTPGLQESADKSEAAPNVSTNRKIIYRYSQTVETVDFDGFLPLLQAKVAELGGYVESSGVDNSGRSRYAHFTIRMPKNADGPFTGFLTQNSNVIQSSTSTEDVTLQYVDMESRLSAYREEKAKLEELLQNAKDLSEVLQIQDRLTQVIYEIEAYESRLRTYDNLIDYTTFNLTVREVQQETVTEELTVWQTIGRNLADGFVSVADFLVNFFVFLISAIPYLLLLSLFAIPIFFLIKALRKRNKKKKTPPETP